MLTFDNHRTIAWNTQEDKAGGEEIGKIKQLMAHNWVEPSKRERKRVLNYNESEYYKQALKTGGGGGKERSVSCMPCSHVSCVPPRNLQATIWTLSVCRLMCFRACP